MEIKQIDSKFENNPVPEIQEDVIKHQLERNKEFAVLEVIEQLEKENAELKKEIKMYKSSIHKLNKNIRQMENCHNCRHCGFYPFIGVDNGCNCELVDCQDYDKWELKIN